jgi:hypothetical protein
MKKAEQEEMDRLRHAVDRLTSELRTALDQVTQLQRQLVLEEGRNLAFRELLEAQQKPKIVRY